MSTRRAFRLTLSGVRGLPLPDASEPRHAEVVATWPTRSQRAIDLFGGAVAPVPGGVAGARSGRELRSRRDRSAGLAGGVRRTGSERRRRAGCCGSWVRSTGARPASIQRPLPGPRPGRVRRVHRAGHQRPHAGLRHGARGLPRGPGGQGRRHHPRDRPLRDRLHRPAAGRVRRGADRRGAPRGLRPPALHPGRSLPGQRQEVPGRSRGRGGRGQEADRRGGRRRLLQHRRGHLDAGGPVPADPRGAAARSTTSARPRSPPSSARTSPRASPCRWARRSAKWA